MAVPLQTWEYEMIRTLTVLSLALAASTGFAAVSVGEPAPNFTLTDANGQSHQLSDFATSTPAPRWNGPMCSSSPTIRSRARASPAATS